VLRSLGFDPKRTSFFIVNHVNSSTRFFFVLQSRSRCADWNSNHIFKIPLYGILMRRFGMYRARCAEAIRPKRLWRETRAALDSGMSLIVFAEVNALSTGEWANLKTEFFRMAVQFGYPIVPVSTTGSFEFNRKDRWWLHPSNIVVHITTRLKRLD